MQRATRTILTRPGPSAHLTARRFATEAAASQLHGHTRWIQGAASTALGALTASPALKATGATQRAEGVAEMRRAKEKADHEVAVKLKGKTTGGLQVEGRGEGLAGWIVGCPGMKERGRWKVGEAAKRGPRVGRGEGTA